MFELDPSTATYRLIEANLLGITDSGHFPLGSEFCTFWITMDVLMCTASIWHMCTMSMDRYFTLKYPMQYGRNKTKTMVAVKIVFVWLISIFISSPIGIYALVDQKYVYNENSCLIAIKNFVIYGSVFAFYVPLFIMILTYMLTIRILWQNQHMMRTIERSNFRMRPRTNNKSTNVMTYLSPPSSDSRRESHTDVSSLARTPISEKQLILSDCTESEMKLLEMKNAFDNHLAKEMCSKIQNGLHSKQPNNLENSSFHDSESVIDTSANLGESSQRTNGNNSAMDKSSNSNITESNRNTNLDSLHPTDMSYLDNSRRMGGSTLSMTTVQIQSPSSDDEDEYSSLLYSKDKLSRSLSHHSSTTSSKFRLRTNMDTNKPYLTTTHSLKIPKHHEKNSHNLQASVSCSNFGETTGENNELFESLHGGGNGLNRDYKSLEWCHHFYEIQEEMDACLRESKHEQKIQSMKEAVKELRFSSGRNYNAHTNSTDTHDSGIASCSITREQSNQSKHQALPGEISESGDSLDDIESSSENASELINIKLYPKSVYMYKLDVDRDLKKRPKVKCDSLLKKTTASVKRRSYKRVRDTSTDSESAYKKSYVGSNSDSDKMLRRKKSSIKRFIYKCKKKNGFRNLVSSKTTTNEKKASKVLGIIFGVFVILWSPFFIANILMATCTSCGKYITAEMMSSFVWMGYIASLANPIIYTMFNTAFRRAFIKILSCHLCTHGRSTFRVPSYPSHIASVLTDRRQTLTVLTNGHLCNQERLLHDGPSNLSNGR